MISLNFNLNNPWSKRWSNAWNRVYKLPIKNKFIELEVVKDTTIVSCTLRLTTRESHSGLFLQLGILGYSFSFNFYDNRHWSDKFDRYINDGEE